MTEDKKRTLRQIKKALKEFPKVVKQKEAAYKEREKILKAFMPMARDLKKRVDNKKLPPEDLPRIHPWRLCPGGHFFRRSHKQKGYTRRSGVSVSPSIQPNECVVNKTGKDQLYSDEIQRIAETYFGDLTGPPTEDDLGRKNGNNYDDLVRGWTKYWNEVLKPIESLDPNLVKALIASESDFNPDPRRPKKDVLKARGLMQVTDESRKMLSGAIKELDDHFVHVNLEDMTDPNLNIASGIRWLFRKKQIADSLGNANGWPGAILKYKSYSSMDHPQMQKLMGFYERLNQ